MNCCVVSVRGYRANIVMAKSKTAYQCSECGAQSPKWAGQCGDCGAWNSMEEVVAVKKWAEPRPATTAANAVSPAPDASGLEAEAPAREAPELGDGRPGGSDEE